MLLDHIVGQSSEVLMLFPVIEDFERAEADMGGRHADQHRAGFDLFPIDRVIAADDAERACGGDAEAVQCFAAKIFADRRAQHRSTVAVA